MRRASSLPAPITTDVVEDSKFYAVPTARGTYRYNKQDKVRVIRQGNKQLVVHYQNPPAHKLAWLFPAGMGVIVTLISLFLMSVIANWWNNWQTEAKYGYPRTSQLDAVVGHYDSDQYPSHFIFANLHGHIVIIEISGEDATHSHIYTCPTLLGDGADKIPVTGSFNDEDGDGKLDLILSVEKQRIVYINDGNEFKQQQ